MIDVYCAADGTYEHSFTLSGKALNGHSQWAQYKQCTARRGPRNVSFAPVANTSIWTGLMHTTVERSNVGLQNLRNSMKSADGESRDALKSSAFAPPMPTSCNIRRHEMLSNGWCTSHRACIVTFPVSPSYTITNHFSMSRPIKKSCGKPLLARGSPARFNLLL